MKYETLRKLYAGEIVPFENFKDKLDELKEQREYAFKGYEEFLHKLPVDLQDEYKHVLDSHLEVFPLEYEQTFIDGFQLGIKIMIDVFS